MVEDYSGSARVPSPPLDEQLGEVRMPSLVITGAHDISDFQSVANALAARLPAVRRLIIQNSGHMVNLEAPREFKCSTPGILAE
jgi:3-oxoadipate enol-lactonase